MKQKLTHWVSSDFKKKVLAGKGIPRRRDRRLSEKFEMKPSGFWISVNNSWEEWLDGNWDSWMTKKYCLNVELDKDIKLFVIKTKAQFLKEYKLLTGKDYLKLPFLERYNHTKFHDELKKKYDGIMLTSKPFWKHRLDMDFMYFYPWDCESICVWNKKKIKFNEVVI